MPGTLIVIGGGAAGFFCAVNAARMSPGLKILIVEKSGKLLSKVKISGGGRCNLAHACFDILQMSENYPRGNFFVRKMFRHFFTGDTLDWFAQRGVRVKTEEDGRMFPESNTSQTIVDCLLNEAGRLQVEIRLRTEIKEIKRNGNEWQLYTPGGDRLTAQFVCVACGGYPKSSMFDWLRTLGHSIEEPAPSLFTFNLPHHEITRLMGVAVADVQASVAGSKLTERNAILITHWGLSGPVILRLSAWGARKLSDLGYRFNILINWIPGYHEQTLREKFRDFRIQIGGQQIIRKNGFDLPRRLWDYLVLHSGITENTRWADLTLGDQNRLIRNLLAHEFVIEGKTTYKEEFTTAGGIRLSEIDPNTMQSKIAPNLFFAGEIMDVDGITGGFNFQHAWSSGFVAARAIAGLESTALDMSSHSK